MTIRWHIAYLRTMEVRMLALGEETQAVIAADRLRADILTGTLTPGSKLRVAELKKLYGIGASPLREALSRVTSMGYVTSESRRGYRVAKVSQEDLADITRARQIIEAGMLRESIEIGRDDWESGIVAAVERLRWAVRKSEREGGLNDQRVGLAHKSFHIALVSGSSSPRLVAMQDLLFDQALRYREMMISELGSGTAFLLKHEELADIVLSGDVELAVNALSGHLHLTLRDVYGSPAGS